MKFSVLLVGTLFLAGLAACDNSSNTPGDDDVSTPDGAPADAVMPTPDADPNAPDAGDADAATPPPIPDGGGPEADAEPPPPLSDGGVHHEPDAAPLPPSPDAGPLPPLPDGGTPPPTGATLHVCATGATYSTINAAVTAAAAGDIIQICAGTYHEHITINKVLTLRGASAATTIIDGQASGTVLNVHDVGQAPVVIDNLTIKGGAGTTQGGGIRCLSSVLTVTSSVLSNNTAPGGAGLYAGGCILDVHDVTFSHNDAGTANGGGAMLEGSTGILRNSTFTSNVGEHGGGLNMVEGHVAILANEFASNHGGSEGGGIWSSSDAEIGSNHIHDNAGGWTGGGIYVFEHAPLVHDNVITGNTSGNDGAGCYFHISHATIRHNTISHNTADDDAGGLRIFESAALIESNTIENNVAADGGGGIKVSHVPSTFIGNIVRGNRAGTGGGFMMDDDASTITGGEVSGNTASGGGAFYIDLAPWTGAHLSGILVSGNHAWIGGAFMITSNIETVNLDAMTIVGNDATNIGGAILARGSAYRLAHSLVAHNSALQGGAIYHGLPDPWTDPCPCPDTVTVGKVEFTTFVGNTSTHGDATAIYAESDGLTIENSILSAHTGTAVTVASGAPITFRYDDLQPATFSGMSSPVGSNGNISVDPGFVNAAANDFHLTAGSACKNAGDPAMMDADGSRADLGMYGGM